VHDVGRRFVPAADLMRILIVTETFPPICGGAGWSSYELARGLRARGHDIVVVQPWPRVHNAPPNPTAYDGFRIRRFVTFSPPIPFVRNYFNNERLYPYIGRQLRRIIEAERIDVVHAQHRLSGPPAIAAARAQDVPVVCTVRDYWPVCYWSDLIHDFDSPTLCPGCSPGMMTRCIRPRTGAAWPLALAVIPYMWANLAGKRRALADADAVIAVSSTIAADLKARAPELARTRVVTIPNPVDITALQQEAARTTRPLDERYAVYVGKIARNKGTFQLVPVLERAKLRWPVVVIGDGPDRADLEETASAAGADVRFTGWLSRSDVVRWLAHAELLVFPSYGPESLSRVLIESAAVGVPIAAMETGGTRDIITTEITGLLSRTPDQLADDVARLAADASLRARLAGAAQAHVQQAFDAPLVVERVEELYRDLVRERGLPRRTETVPATLGDAERRA
jgi:glycosyltransferase involved in cell wall biosynthesis